jgi:hypothetical protein
MEVSEPAFAIGLGLKIITLSSETAGHGVKMPVAVKVKTTLPVVPEEGIYVAFKVLAFGIKLPPVGVDCHVPLVAPPLTRPFKTTDDPSHSRLSTPALTTAIGFTVIVFEMVFVPQLFVALSV